MGVQNTKKITMNKSLSKWISIKITTFKIPTKAGGPRGGGAQLLFGSLKFIQIGDSRLPSVQIPPSVCNKTENPSKDALDGVTALITQCVMV